MANLTTTNVDTGNVLLAYGEFRDYALTFAGAGTVRSGTILARNTGDQKLIPYVKGGSSNGNGVPAFVMTYDVVATAAGDVQVRALISGVVRKERLIIVADGNATNIDNEVIDGLRDLGIIPLDVFELLIQDNQ